MKIIEDDNLLKWSIEAATIGITFQPYPYTFQYDDKTWTFFRVHWENGAIQAIEYTAEYENGRRHMVVYR